jgi:hypothetical protein
VVEEGVRWIAGDLTRISPGFGGAAFSEHAAHRMDEQGVKLGEVETTLFHPHRRYPSNKLERMVAERDNEEGSLVDSLLEEL